MGNIQSFNNFASTITNTFSLPFINKMLKKNNLTDLHTIENLEMNLQLFNFRKIFV